MGAFLEMVTKNIVLYQIYNIAPFWSRGAGAFNATFYQIYNAIISILVLKGGPQLSRGARQTETMLLALANSSHVWQSPHCTTYVWDIEHVTQFYKKRRGHRKLHSIKKNGKNKFLTL